MIKAVLLDRDGTINASKRNLHEAENFEFLPGAIDGMKQLYKNDFKLFVITNQPGIALNYFPLEDVEKVHRYMLDVLHKEGVEIEKVYCCPHHPSVADCPCRKPKPGMLEAAIAEFGIDVSKSYMIGNNLTDIEAGKAVGLKTILIFRKDSLADYCCSNLTDAARIIL